MAALVQPPTGLDAHLPPEVVERLKAVSISTPFQLLAHETYALSHLVHASDDHVDEWKRLCAAEVLSSARMLVETEQQMDSESFVPTWRNFPPCLPTTHLAPLLWCNRPTGSPAIDALLYTPTYGGGLPAGRLVEINGPSGSGRTALGLSCACACAAQGIPALVVDCSNGVVCPQGREGVVGLLMRTMENLERAAEAEATLGMRGDGATGAAGTTATGAGGGHGGHGGHGGGSASTPSKLRHSVGMERRDGALGRLRIARCFSLYTLLDLLSGIHTSYLQAAAAQGAGAGAGAGGTSSTSSSSSSSSSTSSTSSSTSSAIYGLIVVDSIPALMLPLTGVIATGTAGVAVGGGGSGSSSSKKAKVLPPEEALIDHLLGAVLVAARHLCAFGTTVVMIGGKASSGRGRGSAGGSSGGVGRGSGGSSGGGSSGGASGWGGRAAGGESGGDVVLELSKPGEGGGMGEGGGGGRGGGEGAMDVTVVERRMQFRGGDPAIFRAIAAATGGGTLNLAVPLDRLNPVSARVRIQELYCASSE